MAGTQLVSTTLLHRPGESRVYAFDFGSIFPELFLGGEVLTSPGTVTATPSGLTLGSPEIATKGRLKDTGVNCTISGGTDGVDYLVKCSLAVTSGGNKLTTGGTLQVRAVS